MIEDLTESFEQHEQNKGTEEVVEEKPDSLTQLMTTFSRKAITDHGAAAKEDMLYMEYAYLFSQSCGGAEEEEEEEGNEEDEGGASIHVSYDPGCLCTEGFWIVNFMNNRHSYRSKSSKSRNCSSSRPDWRIEELLR